MNVITKKPEINMRARPTNLVLLDYATRQWGLFVPPDVGMDQLLLPEFWAHVAVRQLKPFDDVRVSCEDGSWTALLFAREVERAAARMGVIWYKNFDEADCAPKLTPAEREEYEVKYRGPQIKHVVIRKSDKQEMIRNITKRAAEDYIRERMKMDAG